MLSVVRPADPALERLLSSHPGVSLVSGASPAGVLEFDGRRLVVGDPSLEVAGLIELCDNNPWVCASEASVPGPVATLALIALGPLVRAGLLVEAPVMQVAGARWDGTEGAFLALEGWDGGVEVSVGDEDFGSVVAANVIAVVRTPTDWSSIDELYRESFGRSFFVREHTVGTWDVSLVAGRAFALYDLACSPGDETSLLTVRAMADRDGKCGAGQMVHAMNVMCGFEESLGTEGAGG